MKIMGINSFAVWPALWASELGLVHLDYWPLQSGVVYICAQTYKNGKLALIVRRVAYEFSVAYGT